MQNNTDKLISVIVPIYNVEKYIEKCINSILCQTYTALEIILVDDGSTDQCGNICDVYMKRDSRIQVIHKANGGLSDARNAGLDQATGEYLVFIDSDDFIDPKYIAELAICQKETGSDICVSRIIQRGRKETKEMFPNSFHDLEILSVAQAMRCLATETRMSTCAWNKIYRRDLFKDIRFPVGKIHEDQFIMYKLFYAANQIAISKKAIYYYMYRQESITNRTFNIKRLDDIEACTERLVFFKEFFPEVVTYAEAHLFHQAVWIEYAAKKASYTDQRIHAAMKKIYQQYIFKFLFCKDYSIHQKISTFYKLIFC